jgi:F-type H+-transporting ATPase subunit epsilon
MATFELEVATPERLLIRQRVAEAQIPAANGMIGVLPDHAALLSALGTGPLTFTGGEGRKTIFITGGWMQIRNNHVRVLTEQAEFASDIDTSRAEAALKRALERLSQAAGDNVDVARALNAQRRAEARIAAAKAGHVPER